MSKPPKRIVRFNPAILSVEDFWTALGVLRYDPNIKDPAIRLASLANAQDRLRKPSAVVHDDDGPIMYRWHVVPRNDLAGVYFHIQVRSDSITRGPHDHEYDSFGTILGGRYVDEEWDRMPPSHGYHGWIAEMNSRLLERGDVIQRRADQLHRIVLPEGTPYSMSLFSHGPRVRKWGFANPDGSWVAADAVGEIVDGTVMAKGRAAT